MLTWMRAIGLRIGFMFALTLFTLMLGLAGGYQLNHEHTSLLERDLDGLVIATSTPGHVPLLRLAARAGLPAFCEKPVALELAPLDELIDEVERAGILVQIGFQRRFDAGYRAARDAVAEGALGEVLALRAATHDPAPPSEAYIASSGGIFRDLHIHDFDAIRFVTGREVVDVYADGAVRATRWFADHGDVDAAAAVLRLQGGPLAVLTGTRRDPLGYDVRLGLRHRGQHRRRRRPADAASLGRARGPRAVTRRLPRLSRPVRRRVPRRARSLRHDPLRGRAESLPARRGARRARGCAGRGPFTGGAASRLDRGGG